MERNIRNTVDVGTVLIMTQNVAKILEAFTTIANAAMLNLLSSLQHLLPIEMEDEGAPLQGLLDLQRDLDAFAQSKFLNIDRLSAELDASIEVLKRLLDQKRKSEASRRQLTATSGSDTSVIQVDGEEYEVNQEFVHTAIQVADNLDLDELEAAKLCLDASNGDIRHSAHPLPVRAIAQYMEHRRSVLRCMQLLLQQSVEADDEEVVETLKSAVLRIVRGQGGRLEDGSAYWRKCVDGLGDIENSLKRVSDHKQTIAMTGQGGTLEALDVQSLLLTQQHECLTCIMSYLIRGHHVIPGEFRRFLTKASALESDMDIAIHYLPIIMSGSAYFGADNAITHAESLDLHRLFAEGPGQLQWKQSTLKAAATILWVCEHSSRYTDSATDPEIRVSERQRAEEERSLLFMKSVRAHGLHFILSACTYLKPEVWHDPAKTGLVTFLLGESGRITSGAPPASSEFVALTLGELQSFADAFVTNMPDVLRRLKVNEDDQRRELLSRQMSDLHSYELDLERFMVIMSYAYQDDPDAVQDFWSDKESNLYGFLRWVSQRLPTPRVAAFCQLLASIANDSTSANHAHRFLLEDTTMISGKLRKTHGVSWSQIFAEFDIFANSIKDRPAVPQTTSQQSIVSDLVEAETNIMLESYLRLASHMCRTSPDARNWILREQPFLLGDVLFQLASSGVQGRIQACCFDLLSAMLTEKVQEVNDGMWAMLDSWIAAGGVPVTDITRTPHSVKSVLPERYYLQRFNDNPETASAFVGLLTALITPIASSDEDSAQDGLPFPETLGPPHRHAGIDSYVDFVAGHAFRFSEKHAGAGYDQVQLNVLRFTCLEFLSVCLATFNENLVMIGNRSNIAIDDVVKTSSLAAYMRLHPFARVMDWLFNNNVISVLFSTAMQSPDELNGLNSESPAVKAVIMSIHLMNQATQLQTTYFTIIRPMSKTQPESRRIPVSNAAFGSFDAVLLSQLEVTVDLMSYACSKHLPLAIESLDLMQRITKSNLMADGADASGGRMSDRVISTVINSSDAIAIGLIPDFQIVEADLEDWSGPPAKLVRARQTLLMLNNSLDTSPRSTSIATLLLGFERGSYGADHSPGSLFANESSLFHALLAYVITAPTVIVPSHVSWLLGLKRGCLEVILKVALSPLTRSIIIPELRRLDFLPVLSRAQVLAVESPTWDGEVSTEQNSLLGLSAIAIRDFMHLRSLFFTYAALELRSAAASGSLSVVESIIQTLQGNVLMDNGEEVRVHSIFELLDFFDIPLAAAYSFDVRPKFLADVNFSVCDRDDQELGVVSDIERAQQLGTLRKRELVNKGAIKDIADETAFNDEFNARQATMMSTNYLRGIKAARSAALESWTELLSLVTVTGSASQNLAAFSLRALTSVLPILEKCLSTDLEQAAFLAKLTLALIPGAVSETPGQSQLLATYEKLLFTFRICLKGIVESEVDLALRDVCYRICYTIVTILPLSVTNGTRSPAPNAKQLMALIHTTNERVLTVISEDAFSGRGPTRVSSLLLLDCIVLVAQTTKASSGILSDLSKLNFLPVLLDTSIGNVAASFQAAKSDDMITALAYYHTALALLMRICQSAEGAQLVLNAGFITSVNDSRLFSTDPDIGIDIDNPSALNEFFRMLSAILRVLTAIVSSKPQAIVLQEVRGFIQQHRFNVQAVFKRTRQHAETEVLDVAEGFSRLMWATGFLQCATHRTTFFFPCASKSHILHSSRELEELISQEMEPRVEDHLIPSRTVHHDHAELFKSHPRQTRDEVPTCSLLAPTLRDTLRVSPQPHAFGSRPSLPPRASRPTTTTTSDPHLHQEDSRSKHGRRHPASHRAVPTAVLAPDRAHSRQSQATARRRGDDRRRRSDLRVSESGCTSPGEPRGGDHRQGAEQPQRQGDGEHGYGAGERDRLRRRKRGGRRHTSICRDFLQQGAMMTDLANGAVGEAET
nr:nucleoporin [Quercus suber]